MKSILIEALDFNELSLSQLYQILALRMEVFCVEQSCPYQDLDDQDQTAKHILLLNGDELIAYSRVLSNSRECSIGRVVVKSHYRNKGLAKNLMHASIKECIKHHPRQDIIISAQSYLQDFYYQLGFVSRNKYYLEDDIPHEEMIYVKKEQT